MKTFTVTVEGTAYTYGPLALSRFAEAMNIPQLPPASEGTEVALNLITTHPMTTRELINCGYEQANGERLSNLDVYILIDRLGEAGVQRIATAFLSAVAGIDLSIDVAPTDTETIKRYGFDYMSTGKHPTSNETPRVTLN